MCHFSDKDFNREGKMYLEDFFLDTSSIEVGPTFKDGVLVRIHPGWGCSDTSLLSSTLEADSYDNYFRQSQGIHGYIPINTIVSLLRVQIDGRSQGPLLVQGEQNVFYCKAVDRGIFGTDGIVLQAQWLPNYRNVHRWLVLGWEMEPTTGWPNWGSYRPKGTKIFWNRISAL
jgi:hypothetical protein